MFFPLLWQTARRTLALPPKELTFSHRNAVSAGSAGSFDAAAG